MHSVRRHWCLTNEDGFAVCCLLLLLLLLLLPFIHRFVPTPPGVKPMDVEAATLNLLDFPANKQLNNKMRCDFKVHWQGSSRDVSSFPVLQGEAAAAAHEAGLEQLNKQKLAHAAGAAEVFDSRQNLGGGFDQQAVSRPGSSPRYAYVGAAVVAGSAAASQVATKLAATLSAELQPLLLLSSMARGKGPGAEDAEAFLEWLNGLGLDSLKKLLAALTGQQPPSDAKATGLRVSRLLTAVTSHHITVQDALT
jgi:hypothetical protein